MHACRVESIDNIHLLQLKVTFISGGYVDSCYQRPVVSALIQTAYFIVFQYLSCEYTTTSSTTARSSNMLRRPPTVLSLTAEDLKAYEDRHEAEAFKAALAAQKQTLTPSNTRQLSHINDHNNNNTNTTTTSSSSYEDISEANNGLDDDDDEDSYYPRRYRTIDNHEDDGDIYRNEVDASPSSNSGSVAAADADGEDQVMAELAPDELEARESSAAPVSRFGRRAGAGAATAAAAAAAAAITPTPGVTLAGRTYGGAAAVVTPEAPARQTRSRDERITGRGGRR